MNVVTKSPLGARARSGRQRGFTLLELLVAAAVASLVLSAAYGWLWNVAAEATRMDDRAQAATIASAVSRAIAADVHDAAAVDAPPSGRDPSRSLALVHDHVDVAREALLVVWDPTRSVVWRNASGTYLADHVIRFSLAYDLADGRHVAGANMSSRDWLAVRVVHIELAVAVGSAVATRAVVTAVGPA